MCCCRLGYLGLALTKGPPMTPAEHAALREALAKAEDLTDDSVDEFFSVARNHLPGILAELDALKADRDRLLAENARLREGLAVTREGVHAAKAMVEQRGFIPDWDWLRSIRRKADALLTELEGAKT